ncbi:hypothetical protein SNE40_013768 [Patella caerulea]|uniref:MANSC domain-containing protein n=1 Tax=Patella caerulea TaxID=87958 RepID=A0AAN8PPA1_PATCE
MLTLTLISVCAALGYQVTASREDSDDPDTGGMIRIESFSTHSTSYQILSSMTIKDPDICISNCLENPECDVTVVCSFSCSPLTVCFHVKGNVFRNVCTSKSLTGCYAKPRVSIHFKLV